MFLPDRAEGIASKPAPTLLLPFWRLLAPHYLSTWHSVLNAVFGRNYLPTAPNMRQKAPETIGRSTLLPNQK